jgi:hypothetical protein
VVAAMRPALDPEPCLDDSLEDLVVEQFVE